MSDSNEINKSNNRNHGHYFKDVSQLSEIDVYRVCQLFGVDDSSGALQHAIKKLLLPGKRGAGKNYRKDIQEAIDTLTRRLEMMDEDNQVPDMEWCQNLRKGDYEKENSV